MRKYLPFVSFIAGTLLASSLVTAQQADRFAYAITDINQQGANWSFLRKLDLQTRTYSQVLLSGNDASLLAYNAATKKQFTTPLTDAQYGTVVNAAFATNVAAMAYDQKNDRLYYTPMLIDQLRYIDLRTMKVYYVTDKVFTGMPQKSSDQGNIITRMVIASDGNGYAMTNDGMHLMKFTTGKKINITDLGALIDAPSNNGVSVHNSCSSFGGDMVADDDGNLFVFSARNNVFKVNTESKVATFLGNISGLPNGFTTNGAAVTENNKVIVNSAMEASCFTVDMNSLAATPYKIEGTVWHSSDLANGNLLVSGKKPSSAATEISFKKIADPISTDNKVSIYPNPVTSNQFVVQFKQLDAGNYTLQVTDVMGRQAVQQAISLNGENQAQTVKLNPSAARGIYLVKVVDQNGKVVYSTKVVVQ